jgi:hypothetical protein
MPNALTLERMSPQLRKVAARREPCRRKSGMVEISLSGSGEGLGRATGRGYSTPYFILAVRQHFGEDYTAAHDGRFPASLKQIKDLPIPVDPGTGKEFEYELHGDNSTLTSPALAGESNIYPFAFTYELTFKN